MKRRTFIGTAAGTVAAVAAARGLRAAPESGGIVDTNVSLGEWPFRPLPLDEPGKLEKKCAELGVREAWAGSFDALFHRDFDRVNDALARICEGSSVLRPMGAVNPRAPGWRETLRRCDEEQGMRGVRLHPNYREYGLDDAAVVELLEMARERGMLVQIVVRMEDTRTQHPRAAVADVKVQPLLDSLAKVPGVRMQLLNALRTVRDPLLLARLGKFGVGVETAMLEGIEGVRVFLDGNSGVGLCYGSHAPFFYPESAQLKLVESELSDVEEAAVRRGNAMALLKG